MQRKILKTATNERGTRIMEEPRRVYKTDHQGKTSIPPRPDVLYGIMQNQEQIRYNQNVLSNQMNYLAGNVNNVLVKYKKDHKRRTDFFLHQQKGDYQAFSVMTMKVLPRFQ